MKFDPQKHHRHSIRLKGYDYAQAGAYFITIVTCQRECLFGEIVDGIMHLSAMGQIADEHWRAIPEHFPQVDLGAHVIMPNHGHGIIVIRGDGMATNSSPSVRIIQQTDSQYCHCEEGRGAEHRGPDEAISFTLLKQRISHGIASLRSQ